MGVVFLTLLAAGFLGVLSMCPLGQVAWKFVRLVTLLVLVELSCSVAAYLGLATAALTRTAVIAAALIFLTGLCAFVAMGLAPVGPRYAPLMRLLSVLGALLGLGASMAWAADQRIWAVKMSAASAVQTSVSMASAFLLGSVSLAMLLGHAYLTHTEMTIQPLRRLANLFVTAMILRVLLAAGAGAYCWFRLRQGLIAVDTLRAQQLVLIVRYIVGLAVPAVFCYMVWRTVKLRATQSATGILYFALVLIYLGELAAIQLTRELGIPF